MSGLVPLAAITKSCCALQELRRRRWIREGRQFDSPFFTCTDCGSAYRWDAAGWHHIDARQSLKDMVDGDPRGHRTVEGE